MEWEGGHQVLPGLSLELRTTMEEIVRGHKHRGGPGQNKPPAGDTGKLNREIRTEVEEVARRMGPEIGVEGIVLFGSVARGKADWVSDADLAVVGTAEACAGAPKALGKAIKSIYAEILRIKPEADLEEMRNWGDVRREALETGILVWGKLPPEVETVLRETPRPMPISEINWRQGTQGSNTGHAVREWSELQEQETDREAMRCLTGRSSAVAANLFVRNALLYRGYYATHEQDLKRLLNRGGTEK